MSININCRDCCELIEQLYYENDKWTSVYYCTFCGHPIRDIEQNVDCIMFHSKYDN